MHHRKVQRSNSLFLFYEILPVGKEKDLANSRNLFHLALNGNHFQSSYEKKKSSQTYKQCNMLSAKFDSQGFGQQIVILHVYYSQWQGSWWEKDVRAGRKGTSNALTCGLYQLVRMVREIRELSFSSFLWSTCWILTFFSMLWLHADPPLLACLCSYNPYLPRWSSRHLSVSFSSPQSFSRQGCQHRSLALSIHLLIKSLEREI